jgi:hypothetical protein
MLKKLLLSLLVSTTLLFSVAPYLQTKAASQSTWYSQDPVEWYTKVYNQTVSPPNEIFGERYTAAQVQWIIYSLAYFPIRIIASTVGDENIACLMNQMGQQVFDINECAAAIGNTLTDVTNFIFPQPQADNNQSFLYKVFDSSGRSISGIGYTKDLLAKLSPVSTVKAQGIGYTGLTWIQGYWKNFRNMAYMLLIPIVIIFAFMIMFRVKLNPQTVISVQSALPKIITALVLITFSYAIAGFAIDLMYVFSGLIALLLTSSGFANISNTSLSDTFGQIAGTAWGYSAAGGFWVLFEMIGYTFAFFIAAVVIIITSLLSGFNLFGAILGVVFAVIAVWVLVLTLWYTFKIPFILVKTLVSVYISIIFAPIQILGGALVPSMGFGPWFKRLMADILVFPLVGLLFWFAWAFLHGAYQNAVGDVLRYWTNSSISSTVIGAGQYADAWIPGIVGAKGMGSDSGITGIIFLAMSFGCIVLIPKAPDLLKSMILGERFAFGTAIGEAMGYAGSAYGMSGAKDTVGLAKRAYSAQRMEDFYSDFDANRGLFSSGLKKLESNKLFGKRVTDIVEKVRKGQSKTH